MPTKTYSQEFKLEIAMQIVDYSSSVIDAAQAMDLGKSTVAHGLVICAKNCKD